MSKRVWIRGALAAALGGCAPTHPYEMTISNSDSPAVVEAPSPGREFNGVVSCENPLRGGCVFLVGFSDPTLSVFGGTPDR